MHQSLPSSQQKADQAIEGLTRLLEQHSNERVVVVGTTCTGKSTMVALIPGARDMDKEVFPRLTKEESAYVCQEPWTEEIGRTMVRLVRERVHSEVGRPVFGTVVIDSDLVILLKISDPLLASRVALREATFSDAKNMQAQLEEEVRSSALPWVEYSVG